MKEIITEEIINGKLRFLCSELFSKCFSFFSIKPFEDVNSYTFASHTLLSLSSLQINLGVFKVFLVSVAAYGISLFLFFDFDIVFCRRHCDVTFFWNVEQCLFSIHLKMNARNSLYLHQFQTDTLNQ